MIRLFEKNELEPHLKILFDKCERRISQKNPKQRLIKLQIVEKFEESEARIIDDNEQGLFSSAAKIQEKEEALVENSLFNENTPRVLESQRQKKVKIYF